jgi:hypothetical protein
MSFITEEFTTALSTSLEKIQDLEDILKDIVIE